MIKTLLVNKLGQLYIILNLMLCAPIATAEIFKWVDDKGRIHFSDSKANVGDSKVEALKVTSPNLTMNYASDLAQTMNYETSVSKLNSVPVSYQHKKKPRSAKTTKASWGGLGPETDKKRCALARAVLNGTARHSNGAPTDTYDKKVAQRDTRKY